VSELIINVAFIFLIYALGFALQRWRPFEPRIVKLLARVVVDILLPIYVFLTTATANLLDILAVAPSLIGMGIGFALLGYVVALLTCRPLGITERQRSVYSYACITANTAFLGFPICAAIFGPKGLIYAVLFDAGASLVSFTLGIWGLNGGRWSEWKPLVFNPLIIAFMLGMACLLLRWTFPPLVQTPIEILRLSTMPAALFMGGVQLSNMHSAGGSSMRPIFALGFVRLLLIPLLAAVILAALRLDPMVHQVALIQTAMPAGLTTSILAERYDADAKFGAAGLLWTTTFSAVTLPIIIFLALNLIS
jgi:malate permease and related proteins